MNALQILKDNIHNGTKKWALESHCESDEVFGKQNGVSSAYCAARSGNDTKTMLREFYRLEKAGLVLRFPLHKGLTVWWPVGYLAELRGVATC